MDINMDFIANALAGIGGPLSTKRGKYKTWQEALGAITQQQIAGESQAALTGKYQDIIGKMVGGDFGDLPEGTKAVLDKEKSVFTIPSKNIFGQVGGDEEGGQPEVIQPPVPQDKEGRTEEKFLPEGGSFLNPSASSITGADVVGLTPKNISQALGGALNVAKFKQRAPYMGALTAESRARTAEQTPSYTAPGIDVPMTRKEYLSWKQIPEVPDKVPVKIADGRVIEVDPKTALTYYAKMNKAPASYETYKLATEDPKYYDYLKDMAERSATQISFGGRVEAEVAKGVGRGIADVTSPDFAQTVREDIGKDKMTWANPPKYSDYLSKGYSDSEATEMARRHMVITEMDSRIRQAYKNKTVVRKSDGWYVDGKLKVRMP